MARKLWYAVLADREDNDWGYGSDSLNEAKEMSKDMGQESYIAVIDVDNENDPLCIAEIEQEDFDQYGDAWNEPEHFQYN